MDRKRLIATVIGGLVLLLTACSADGDTTNDEADGGAMETATEATRTGAVTGEQAAGDAAEVDDDGSSGGGDEPLSVAAPLGRKVIHRAHLTLEVDHPAEVVDDITKLTERAGGFVAGTDLQATGRDDELQGTITIRVPTGRLSNTLQELKGLAVRVPEQTLDTQDVTEEHADIGAQLRNLRALETELVTLLSDIRERSNSADEILVVFERIRQVRDEIERLEGRQQVLDDLVALATVEISILPTEAAVAVVDEGWRPGDTLTAALRTTVGALQNIAEAAIWVAVTVLPISLIFLVPVAGAVYGVRRWRRTPDPTPTA